MVSLPSEPFSAPEPKVSTWVRRFTVLCKSREQKEEMEARARRGGMNLTQFVIHRVLDRDEELLLWKQRAEAAEEKLLALQNEVASARTVLAGVEEAESQVTAARERMNLGTRGPKILRLLDEARSENPQAGVPYWAIVEEMERERDLDDAESGVLRCFLQELVNWGMVERVLVDGRRTYRWRPRF